MTRRYLFGWIILLLIVTVGLVFLGEDSAYHFDAFPMDGTLRLFDPLRRIALGQRGGVDFQVFHGLALPYLFYPLFRLLGTSLFASDTVRNISMPLALVFTYCAVFGALTRHELRGVALATVATLLTIGFHMNTLLIPGISVLGVRTAIALMFVALIAVPSPRNRRRTRQVIEGVVLGLNTALSTEQGVAVVAAYTIVFGLRALRTDDRRRRAIDLATVLAIAAGFFVLVLVAIGGVTGMQRAIHYNFADVAKDQFWYFGTFPTAFLFRWEQLLARPWYTLLLILSAANAAWWLRRVARRRAVTPPRTMAMAVLAMYGPLSATALLAMWVGGYGEGAMRVLLITALTAADFVVVRRLRRGHARALRAYAPHVTGVGALAIAFALNPFYMVQVARAPAHMIDAHIVHHEPPTMSAPWQQTMSVAREVLARNAGPHGQAPLIWSTYTGAVDAANGSMNPSFDYIMDALGPENRAEYLATFKRVQPRVVQTIRPDFSPYEEWLEETSWGLYHELLQNYRVVALAPWSVFWERLAAPKPERPLLSRWDASATDRRTTMTLGRFPVDRPIVLEVEIDYRASNPWARIPLFGKLPRFLIDVQNAHNVMPVPLPPYATTVRFPVVIAGSDHVDLHAIVLSLLPGAHVQMNSVRVYQQPVDSTSLPWVLAFIGASSAQSAAKRPAPQSPVP